MIENIYFSNVCCLRYQIRKQKTKTIQKKNINFYKYTYGLMKNNRQLSRVHDIIIVQHKLLYNIICVVCAVRKATY